MAKVTKRQIAEAKRLLEGNGYTVIPPEQTQVRTADFDDFWESYGKKVERDRCIRLWAKMTPDEKKACIEHVPLYVASTPDKQYRKNPSTYLNNKCWNDEILERPSADRQRQQRLSEAAAIIAKYGKKDQ